MLFSPSEPVFSTPLVHASFPTSQSSIIDSVPLNVASNPDLATLNDTAHELAFDSTPPTTPTQPLADAVQAASAQTSSSEATFANHGLLTMFTLSSNAAEAQEDDSEGAIMHPHCSNEAEGTERPIPTLAELKSIAPAEIAAGGEEEDEIGAEIQKAMKWHNVRMRNTIHWLKRMQGH